MTITTPTETTYHDVVMGTLHDHTIVAPNVKRLTAKRAGELMRELVVFSGAAFPQDATDESIEAEGKRRFHRVGDLHVVNHTDGTTSYTHKDGGGSGIERFLVLDADSEPRTEHDSLTADASGAALIALNIAPMSWRVSNIQQMVREVLDGWRAFGVITDKKVERQLVLDMYVTDDTLTGTDVERLEIALTIGGRVARHHMMTEYASSGSGRVFYADRLAMIVASTAIRRGLFFMTAEQVDAAVREMPLGSRWA